MNARAADAGSRAGRARGAMTGLRRHLAACRSGAATLQTLQVEAHGARDGQHVTGGEIQPRFEAHLVHVERRRMVVVMMVVSAMRVMLRVVPTVH